MRILLIGGTGFIGPALIDQLRRIGHEVILFHRSVAPGQYPDLVHILGDRQNLPAHAEAFRKAAPDAVVDLVLSSGRQARELMETFRGIARRVVALSSMDVYRACGLLQGLEPGPLEPLPLTEDSPLRTQSQTYPAEAIQRLKVTFAWLDDEYDKIPVERAILSGPQSPGTVLRLPFVYGPRDPLRRLFGVIKRVDDGRKVILLDQALAQWRAGRGYVENVTAAIMAAVTSDRAAGRIYNVAEPQVFSELEWTTKVARAAGFNGEIRVIPSAQCPAHLKMPGNLEQHWVPDSSRIRKELNFSEPVPLDAALAATIAWDRANPPQQIDPAKFDYAAEDACLASSEAVAS